MVAVADSVAEEEPVFEVREEQSSLFEEICRVIGRSANNCEKHLQIQLISIAAIKAIAKISAEGTVLPRFTQQIGTCVIMISFVLVGLLAVFNELPSQNKDGKLKTLQAIQDLQSLCFHEKLFAVSSEEDLPPFAEWIGSLFHQYNHREEAVKLVALKHL